MAGIEIAGVNPGASEKQHLEFAMRELRENRINPEDAKQYVMSHISQIFTKFEKYMAFDYVISNFPGRDVKIQGETYSSHNANIAEKTAGNEVKSLLALIAALARQSIKQPDPQTGQIIDINLLKATGVKQDIIYLAQQMGQMSFQDVPKLAGLIQLVIQEISNPSGKELFIDDHNNPGRKTYNQSLIVQYPISQAVDPQPGSPAQQNSDDVDIVRSYKSSNVGEIVDELVQHSTPDSRERQSFNNIMAQFLRRSSLSQEDKTRFRDSLGIQFEISYSDEEIDVAKRNIEKFNNTYLQCFEELLKDNYNDKTKYELITKSVLEIVSAQSTEEIVYKYIDFIAEYTNGQHQYTFNQLTDGIIVPGTKIIVPPRAEIDAFSENFKIALSEEIGRFNRTPLQDLQKSNIKPFTKMFYVFYRNFIFHTEDRASDPNRYKELDVNNGAAAFYKAWMFKKYAGYDSLLTSAVTDKQGNEIESAENSFTNAILSFTSDTAQSYTGDLRETKRISNLADRLGSIMQTEYKRYQLRDDTRKLIGNMNQWTDLTRVVDTDELGKKNMAIEKSDVMLGEMLRMTQTEYGASTNYIMNMFLSYIKAEYVGRDMDGLTKEHNTWNNDLYIVANAKSQTVQALFDMVASKPEYYLEHSEWKKLFKHLSKDHLEGVVSEIINLALRVNIYMYDVHDLASLANPFFEPDEASRGRWLYEAQSCSLLGKSNADMLLTSNAFNYTLFEGKVPIQELAINKEFKQPYHGFLNGVFAAKGYVNPTDTSSIPHINNRHKLETYRSMGRNNDRLRAALNEKMGGQYDPKAFKVTDDNWEDIQAHGGIAAALLFVDAKTKATLKKMGILNDEEEINDKYRKLTIQLFQGDVQGEKLEGPRLIARLTELARTYEEAELLRNVARTDTIEYFHTVKALFPEIGHDRVRARDEKGKRRNFDLDSFDLYFSDENAFTTYIHAVADIKYPTSAINNIDPKIAEEAKKGREDMLKTYSDERQEKLLLYKTLVGEEGVKLLGNVAKFYKDYYKTYKVEVLGAQENPNVPVNNLPKLTLGQARDADRKLYQIMKAASSARYGRAPTERTITNNGVQVPNPNWGKIVYLEAKDFQEVEIVPDYNLLKVLDANATDQEKLIEEKKRIFGLYLYSTKQTVEDVEKRNKLIHAVKTQLFAQGGVIKSAEDSSYVSANNTTLGKALHTPGKPSHRLINFPHGPTIDGRQHAYYDVRLPQWGGFEGLIERWNVRYERRLSAFAFDLSYVELLDASRKDPRGEKIGENTMTTTADKNKMSSEQSISGLGKLDGLIKDFAYDNKKAEAVLTELKKMINHEKTKGRVDRDYKDQQRRYAFDLLFNALKAVLADPMLYATPPLAMGKVVMTHAKWHFLKAQVTFMDKAGNKEGANNLRAYIEKNPPIKQSNITVNASKNISGFQVLTPEEIEKLLYFVAADEESLLTHSPDDSQYNVEALLNKLGLSRSRLFATKHAPNLVLTGLYAGAYVGGKIISTAWKGFLNDLGLGGKKAA